jgi:hypothetical protein
VSTGGRSTTTSVSGAYTLSDVPAGEAQVTVAASGYATEVRQAMVTGGQTTTLNVGMARPGDVAGTVTNSQSGAPVSGATIGYPGGVTVTDATGRYSITGLPAGSHDVTFAATGYSSQDRTVTVTAGGTTTLDVALAPTTTFVTGEVRDSVSQAVLAGATVSVDIGQTTTTDAQGRYRIDLLPGTYQVTASAAGHVSSSGTAVVNGGSYATLDFSLAPTAGSGSTLTFTPTADATVKNTNPTKNYGTGVDLLLRKGDAANTTTNTSYLRFAVFGVAGRSVSSAKVRLRVTDAGPQGGALHRTSNAWTETGVTWNTAPPADGAALAVVGSVALGQWVEFPLPTGTVTGDGQVDLVLLAGAANSVWYGSRESANPPQLIVDVAGGPAPTATPAPTPTVAPTATPTVAPTATPTVAPTATPTVAPTATPTVAPTATPTVAPTATPTIVPTATPTVAPTATPTIAPTPTPTVAPTPTPTPTPPPPPPPGGSTIRQMTFEGGLRDPSTGVDSVTGVVDLDTATPIHGTASARFADTTGYLQEAFPATADTFLSMRLRIVALPIGSPRIVFLSNAGVTVGNITLGSTGRLRLRNGSTTIGADSAALAVGSTYLIGLHQKSGTGANAVLEAFVAPDGETFGAPFARAANGAWTTAADRTRFGATNGTAVDLTVDDVLIGSGSMPAPVASTGAIVVAAAVPGSSYAYTTIDRATGFLAVTDPIYLYACPVVSVAPTV